MAKYTDVEKLVDYKFPFLIFERYVSDGRKKSDEEVYAYKVGYNTAIDDITQFTPAVDVVEVVRCKDCIHRPTDTGGHGDGFDIEFPDNICPCQVEDPYYSWVPKDNWFCPDGERRDDD